MRPQTEISITDSNTEISLEEQPFLDEIRANPDDDAARLVYADWLEERGDVRAEYLRLLAKARNSELPERSQHTKRFRDIPLAWLGVVDSRTAWSRLRKLGDKVRDPEIYPQAWEVARETMRRVRRNVELLVKRLPQAGYQFRDPDCAYVAATKRDIEMLDEIEEKVGPMPLSFRAFHELVGSVDFLQSLDQLVHYYEAKRETASEIETLGEEDPLYMLPVSKLHPDILVDPSEGRSLSRNALFDWREEGPGKWYCFFAADEYHKANYSGGENYNLFIPDSGADFRIHDLFMGESEDEELDREWFVDYLRITFTGGGFRGKFNYGESNQDPPTKAPPSSTLIDQLSEDFLPF